MAYCPECRSEYRAGITECASCGGVKLVDQLPPSTEIREEEIASTQAIGMTGSDDGPLVEIEGQRIDPTRVFVLEIAADLKDILQGAKIPAVIVPLDMIEFPDQRPRFEVRVREADLGRAKELLAKIWREQMEREGVGGADASDVETCPACGAHVPLDVEECPDCGLVVGAGAERSAAEADEE
jgi:hypothetical protein